MANPWFRMWAEFADDPKVQMMTEAMQRRLVMLLCERCKGETFHETERAFHWRVTETELAETKALFMLKGFIDETWNLTNWNKRQFISDSSTERVRRHRWDRKQSETLHERDSNGSETKCNVIDTDTDTEQKKKKTLARSVPPEELAGTLPLVDGTDYKVSKHQVSEWSQAYPGVDVKVQLKKFKVWLDANPTRKKTPRGIAKAIVGWLGRAQDSSHGMGNGAFTNGKHIGSNNLAVLAESLRANQDGSGADGDLQAGESGQIDLGTLLSAASQRTM